MGSGPKLNFKSLVVGQHFGVVHFFTEGCKAGENPFRFGVLGFCIVNPLAEVLLMGAGERFKKGHGFRIVLQASQQIF